MSTAAPRSILDIDIPAELAAGPIATLGPEGTSSEAASRYLGDRLADRFDKSNSDWPVQLHNRYERAADAVRTGAASLLVVANAYQDASNFYMDPRLQILGAYVFDTPLYGIAAATSSPTDGPVRVASHPAPVPLIDELLDTDSYDVIEIIRCDSTSTAAATVAAGAADLALTTEPARELHGLKLVSRARSIRMLWSIFACRRRGA